jgi:hypothetical protein
MHGMIVVAEATPEVLRLEAVTGAVEAVPEAEEGGLFQLLRGPMVVGEGDTLDLCTRHVRQPITPWRTERSHGGPRRQPSQHKERPERSEVKVAVRGRPGNLPDRLLPDRLTRARAVRLGSRAKPQTRQATPQPKRT